MLKSYLTTAIRLIFRNRFYSTVNIVGLSVGLASALLIMLYVADELSYDQFHVNKDRIYRVAERFKAGDEFLATGLTPSALALKLKDNYSQIEETMRIDYDLEAYKVRYKDKEFLENRITAVDTGFFSFFSFKLLKGSENGLLSEPYTIVISDQLANKYFGNENPIGESMTFIDNYSLESMDVKVVGVFESMPVNSHFHKDILVSSATSDKIFEGRNNEWGWTSHFTYIMLAPGHDISEIDNSMTTFTEQKFSKTFSENNQFFTQSLNDIHLRSALKEEFEPNGDIAYVYVFSSIAVFVLLLACINYMNLSTARASKRAKEIGIRKTVGAMKGKIVNQFLGESVILSLISLVVAIIIAEVAMPWFNELSGKELFLDYTDWRLITTALGITIFTGISAGVYPAFILSAFKPVEVLRGKVFKSLDGTMILRKGLVTVQFVISIILIIGTIVVFDQWRYLQNAKLGIDSDHVLVAPLNTQLLRERFTTIKSELERNPNVLGVTASNKRLTTRPGSFASIRVNGKEGSFSLPVSAIDPDFFHTFDIPLVAGREFSKVPLVDTASFIINEAAVKMLGLETPVGQRINGLGQPNGTIVGVIKDFHFESLHTQISPYIFLVRPGNFNIMAIKIKGTDAIATVEQVKATLKQVVPEAIFSYSFLNDDITNLYKSEARFFTVFITFSILAVLIACLGIFGLISFSASQRTKEIGIRKVLGASVSNITVMLTSDYIKLVLYSNIVAWPAAWYCMNLWLQRFSYKIDLGLITFVIATVIALLIAAITVSSQAMKAAMDPPVKSLRSE